MTSEEYVQQVDRLMTYQNVYVGVFIGILSIVLVIFFVFQWRLSSDSVAKMEKRVEERIEIKYKNEISKKVGDSEDKIRKELYTAIKVAVISIIRHNLNYEERVIINAPSEVLNLVLSFIEEAALDQKEIKTILDYINKYLEFLLEESNSDFIIEECEYLEEIFDIAQVNLNENSGIMLATFSEIVKSKLERLIETNSRIKR